MANDQSEKTEEATPKRKQKERDKGHIAKSQDFTSSWMLTLGVGLVFVMGNSMLETLKTTLINTFRNLNPDNIASDEVIGLFAQSYDFY